MDYTTDHQMGFQYDPEKVRIASVSLLVDALPPPEKRIFCAKMIWEQLQYDRVVRGSVVSYSQRNSV